MLIFSASVLVSSDASPQVTAFGVTDVSNKHILDTHTHTEKCSAWVYR